MSRPTLHAVLALLGVSCLLAGGSALQAAEAAPADGVDTAVEAEATEPATSAEVDNAEAMASIAEQATVPDELVVDADIAAQLAKAHSEAALAARARLGAARETGRVDLAPLLPQLSARAGYLRHSDRGRRFAFDDEGDDWTAGARLDQVLYAPDLYDSTFDRRRNRVREQSAARDVVLRNVDRQARAAVTAWALADQTVTIAAERLGQRQDEFDRTSRLADPAVGLASQLDVGETELNLIAAKQTLRAAVNQRDEAYEQLAQAIAREPGTFTVAADLSVTDTVTLLADVDELAAAGPELRQFEALADGAEITARQVSLAHRPRLSAFATADWYGDDADDLDDEWTVGLSLTWTLYDGGGSWAQARAARLQAVAARMQAQAVARDRQRQINQLETRLASLDERIAQAHRAVEVAKTNYAAALASYEQGLIDLTRLGEFSLAVGEQRFSLAVLQAEHRNAVDDLEALLVP